jgi:hypothetical protein
MGLPPSIKKGDIKISNRGVNFLKMVLFKFTVENWEKGV